MADTFDAIDAWVAPLLVSTAVLWVGSAPVPSIATPSLVTGAQDTARGDAAVLQLQWPGVNSAGFPLSAGLTVR